MGRGNRNGGVTRAMVRGCRGRDANRPSDSTPCRWGGHPTRVAAIYVHPFIPTSFQEGWRPGEVRNRPCAGERRSRSRGELVFSVFYGWGDCWRGHPWGGNPGIRIGFLPILTSRIGGVGDAPVRSPGSDESAPGEAIPQNGPSDAVRWSFGWRGRGWQIRGNAGRTRVFPGIPRRIRSVAGVGRHRGVTHGSADERSVPTSGTGDPLPGPGRAAGRPTGSGT